MEEYIKKFIELAAQMPEVPTTILKSAFKTALNSEIKIKLVIINPRSQEQMMILSRGIEIKSREAWKMRGNRVEIRGKSKE